MPIAKYTADAGTIHKIRVSQEVIDLDTNSQTEEAISSPIRVKISKGNREFGIRPRGLRLYRQLTATEGEVTVSKTLYRFMPVFEAAQMEDEAFADEAEIALGDITWTVLAKQAEDF